ncbi:MAG: molybdopterin-dependent oxidoreductase, partial [Methylobacter sp.]
EHILLNTIVGLMRDGGIHSPSLREVEQADAVLILGEDVTNSAPRLALSLRQAARNASFGLAASLHVLPWQDAAVRNMAGQALTPVFIASICATRLDDAATDTYHGSPEDIARLGFAIAHHLDRSAPAPAALSDSEQALASSIADSLKQAKRPLIVSGTACASLAVIQAAYNVAKALPTVNKQLTFIVPECNSLGLAMMGGRLLTQAFERLGNGLADSMVILENDLYRRAPTRNVDLFLQLADHVVVIDSLENKTTGHAELMLPASTFAESEGTLVNNEGRAQRYFPVYPGTDSVRSSWQWLTTFIEDCQWKHLDQLTAACASAFPELANIIRAAPGADYTVEGSKIPRQAHRYSGRTAMHHDVSEPRQPHDTETPFAFSMEGNTAQVLPALLPVIWAPGWNSNQAVNKFQQHTGGSLRGGDVGVRLIEAAGALSWFSDIPPVFTPTPGCWRIMPLPHIFGSEELSLYSPPLLERVPRFSVLLNPFDAETLGVNSGDRVEINSLSGTLVLKAPVQVELTLPRGLLGITAGLPAFQAIKSWDQVTLKKVDREVQL